MKHHPETTSSATAVDYWTTIDGSDVSTLPLADAALHYASRGLRVFPITPGRKEPPKVTDWPNRATTDLAQVTEWWERWPTANIAIATGDPFDVLDFDTADAARAYTVSDAEADGLDVLSAVKTPKGLHLQIRPTGRRNGENIAPEIAEGIDYRGPGGYIVAPPSVITPTDTHPGGTYRWLEQPPRLPATGASLRDVLQPRTAQPDRSTSSGTEVSSATMTPWGATVLAGEAKRVSEAAPGTRNSALNIAAMNLGQTHAAGGFTREQARETLLSACLTNGYLADDGERAFEGTFMSGWEKGITEPRGPGSAVSQVLPDLPPDNHFDPARNPAAPAGPRLYRGSDLDVGTPTQWAARGLLPYGQVAVLVGAEGIGKSLWWVLVTAHLTTGRASPLLGIPAREPRNVLVILTEDLWADVRPRLVKAGADIGRVFVLCEDSDGTGSPVFPRDFDRLEEAIAGVEPALIVLDAWLDTVTGTLSVKDTQQARLALHPWRDVAARSGASVLLVTHTNRSDSVDLRSMIGATVALRQKARVLLFAIRPPGASTELYVGPDKSNHTGDGNAVQYNINTHHVRPATDDDPGTTATLKPSADGGALLRDLHAQWRREEQKANRPPTAAERAEAWVRDNIEDGALVKELQERAKAEEGFTARSLTAAVQALGGRSVPGDGPGSPYVYRFYRQSGQSAAVADKPARQAILTSQGGPQ
jgi:hypothetical protein